MTGRIVHSVHWRLLFNSLGVSLIAIVGVSLAALLLIQLYFQQSELRFLQDQMALLFQPLSQAVQQGARGEELQTIVTMRAYERRVRIRLFDPQGNLLADSGSLGLNPAGTLLPPPTLPVLNAISDQTLTAPLTANSQLVANLELSEGPAIGQPTLDSIRLAIVGSGLIALALAAIVGLLSAQQIGGSLSRLGQVAERMTAGDLKVRMVASGLVEFDQLGEQLHSMADQLAHTIATLEGEKQVLRRLIADASHELRTPLTALKTFNELLQQEALSGREPATTFIRESANQLNHLDRLTAGLLDLSRLEAGLSGANFIQADIRAAVIDGTNSLRQLAQAKSQQLDLAVPRSPLPWPHDPTAIQQAVSNLVNNAIKYAPAGATIQVQLAYENGQIHIIVTDNGPGIPAGEQPHIFKRFYRGPHQQGTGSGLGLAICQEIATIHNGQIHFTSQEGQGTTFTITLPNNPKPFIA